MHCLVHGFSVKRFYAESLIEQKWALGIWRQKILAFIHAKYHELYKLVIDQFAENQQDECGL